MSTRPNILVILVDDMGYSDIGCFGGEIATPHLDRLASGGLRMSQMYNCARCCPTRASLLTGLYPHQAGVGHMVNDGGSPAYQGFLRRDAPTIAEQLRAGGYRTWLAGKWHVGGEYMASDPAQWRRVAGDERHPLPTERGFDRFYGMLAGAGSFWHPPYTMDERGNFLDAADLPEGYFFTDATADAAIRFAGEALDAGTPFFGYLAFTAPHWPLHARPETIAAVGDRYRRGWDPLRGERLERLRAEGIMDRGWELSPRDAKAPDWATLAHSDWQAQRMAVYAAQVMEMDAAVGRVVESLRARGVLEDTLIVFLSDNGGCAEFLREDEDLRGHPGRYGGTLPDGQRVRVGNIPDLQPGGPATFMSYDMPWANASNAPFRLYKSFVHEGGAATPLIAHWPRRIAAQQVVHGAGHVADLAATCLEAAGVAPLRMLAGVEAQPLAGESLLPQWSGRGDGWQRSSPIWWEHQGNAAIRDGDWKLVRQKADGPWELYHMGEDRTECHDKSGGDRERAAALAATWENLAERAGVFTGGACKRG